jgi:lysophospholipase L1-like esterase
MNQRGLNVAHKLTLLSVNIILFMILLVTFEIVLRLSRLGYGNAPLERDSTFHHVHPKNYVFVSHSPSKEYGGHRIFYNAEGLVSNPASTPGELASPVSKEKLVVFLGDSFVESSQVPYDKSFIGILERKFPDHVFLNYGVSSYSPVLYFLQWKYKVKKLLPEKVFMMLYSNDIRDDNNYLSKAVFSKSGELLAVDGGKPNKIVKTLRKSFLLRFIKKAYLQFKYLIERKSTANENVIGKFIEENPDVAESVSAEYVLKIANDARENGVSFFLMAAPSKYNHFHGLFEDENEFARKWQYWAEQNSITFIDLVEGFKEAMINSGKKQFHESDIHFNDYGHKTIAERLEEYL